MEIITRRQYMNASGADPDAARVAHRAYYAQFVTDAHKAALRRSIGLHRIKASTDTHLNDIPLREWDEVMFGTIKGWHPGGNFVMPQSQHGVSIQKLTLAGEWPLTWATLVCILKEAARQMIEEGAA